MEHILDLLPNEENVNSFRQLKEFETCKYINEILEAIKHKYNNKITIDDSFTFNKTSFTYILFNNRELLLYLSHNLDKPFPCKVKYNDLQTENFEDFESFKNSINNYIKSDYFQNSIKELLRKVI